MNDAALATWLRLSRAEDEGFLFALYASTRAAEIESWGLGDQAADALLQMQFRAQALAHAGVAGARNQLIMIGEQPIGRLLVGRSAEEIRVVDIALLPAYRGRGIGTALLRGLLADGAREKKPVRLHVLCSNPAARLYSRLGFEAVGNDGVYTAMQWLPDGAGR